MEINIKGDEITLTNMKLKIDKDTKKKADGSYQIPFTFHGVEVMLVVALKKEGFNPFMN